MGVPKTATIAIVIVTALSWLLVTMLGATGQANVLVGMIPARMSGIIDFTPAIPVWLTPLTSTLVHGNFLHLVTNMIFLLFCGTMVERALGGSSVLLIYLVGAYVAGFAQWAVDPVSMVPVIGASGAVSAVFGAFALSFGRHKRLVQSEAVNRAINALWLLATFIVLQVMVGMFAGTQGVLLAVPAHIGGFLAGLLLQRPLLMWRYRGA